MYFAKATTLTIMLAAFVAADSAHYTYKYDQNTQPVRVRRAPQGEASITGTHGNGVSSLRGDISGTLHQSDHGKLDGKAYYQHNWGANVPKYQTGGGLQYNHNSGAFAGVNVDKYPHSATLGTRAGYNLLQSRDGLTNLKAEGFYNRNYGGFGPRQDYGGFLTFQRRF